MDIPQEEKGKSRLTVDQLEYQAEAVVILRKVAAAEARRKVAHAEMKRLRQTLLHEGESKKMARATRHFRRHTMRRLRALRMAIDWQERQP